MDSRLPPQGLCLAAHFSDWFSDRSRPGMHRWSSWSNTFTISSPQFFPGPPPPYSFVSRVYKRNLRPVVLASESHSKPYGKRLWSSGSVSSISFFWTLFAWAHSKDALKFIAENNIQLCMLMSTECFELPVLFHIVDRIFPQCNPDRSKYVVYVLRKPHFPNRLVKGTFRNCGSLISFLVLSIC